VWVSEACSNRRGNVPTPQSAARRTQLLLARPSPMKDGPRAARSRQCTYAHRYGTVCCMLASGSSSDVDSVDIVN
jgi:hypothetical protein